MKHLYQKYKPHYRDNLTLAIPVVISQLGHMLVQTSDSVIIGHFAGTTSLAAVSLANSVFMVVLVLGLGISYAVTPIIAQASGRNDPAECGRVLVNGLLINILTGLALFIVVYYGMGWLIGHLQQTPAVVAEARPYLVLLGLSVLPLMVFSSFKQFAEGLGFTKQAMQISIWGNLLNIVVGIILVKGLFGFAPMGVKGVGYSTLIDRCLMAFVMAVYILKSKRFRIYLTGFVLKSLSLARTRMLLSIGAPVAMQYVFEISAFAGANILIGRISVVDQAAHQVAISLASITYMMASGLSAAAAIKSGNHFGAKNYSGLRLSAISSYHIVLAFMSVTALIFTFGNHLLPWIYTSDGRVIALAAQLLLIAAVFQLFDGAQVVGLGILRGMGDVNYPTIITFLAYWVVGLPVGYWIGIRHHLGAVGVWYGLVLGLGTAALLLFVRFRVLVRSL